MRTISTGQDTVLRSAAFSVFGRLRVANADGTIVNLTTYGGRDWFNGAEWGANVDEIVPSARVFVARSHSTAASGSLAPLIEASTLNVGDSTDYAALLDPGAEFYIDTATLAQGSTLPGNSSTNWQTQFHGTIDSVDFAGPEIEVYGRDKIGAVMADRWIEEERPYGTEAGTAIETVMQNIADDWADSQTVTTPSSPGFLVTTYNQAQQSVLDSHRTLAQLIGYDVRPRWYNTSSGFAYVFEEPDRAPSTFAMTFGSSGYLGVRRLDISREDVRNVVSVRYTSTGGVRSSYTATDSTSISRYGRRWMEIDLPDDSDINSTSEAAALGDAALSDLAYPEAEQEIETLYFWPVELGDYYRFLANGVHYDQPQDWAVYGYRHVLRQNEHRTHLQVRGTPAGQYRNWFRRGRITRSDNQSVNAKSLLNFRDLQNSTANTVTFSWTRGDLVHEVWIYDVLHAQPESTDPWPGSGDLPTSMLALGTDTYTASLPAADNTRTIQFEPRTAMMEAGPVRRVRLYPRPLTTVDSTDITDGAIVSSKLLQSAQTFGSSIVYSATDNDTVAWTSGTITFASSTQYTIDAGNTGNLASTALRYIYFDTASPSTLNITTNSTDFAGDGKTLLAVAAKAPSTAQNAFFVPAVGILGLNGDNLSPSSVTTNTVAANAITAAKINVVSLSAISADLGTVTAGTVQANVVVAAQSFTASTAVFDGSVTIKGTGAVEYLTLSRNGGGSITFRSAIGGEPHFEFYNAQDDSFRIEPAAVGTGLPNVQINGARLRVTASTVASGEIFTLRSSDIAHGITDVSETDTVGTFRVIASTYGGMVVRGYSQELKALALDGLATNDDTSKGTGSDAPVIITSYKKSGTAVGAVGADANILTVQDAGTTRFIFDAEGSAHADVEWTTFDEYNDLAVIEDMETLLAPSQTQRRFGDVVQHDRKFFERERLLHDVREVAPGRYRGMLNTTRALMLSFGAIRQLAGQLEETRRALGAQGSSHLLPSSCAA